MWLLHGAFAAESIRGVMKTTVLGVRLTDYQRSKLKKLSGDKLEADIVRALIDDYIEGRLLDCRGLIKVAKQRKVAPQILLDAIVEQLNE